MARQKCLRRSIPVPCRHPCPGGVGLTTALVALRAGWVVVGSLPTADGMSDTAQAGCLLAYLFVTNVLHGTVAGNGSIVHGGTVVRVTMTFPENGMPVVQSLTTIGSGFAERTDPAALVIGPTGVGFAADGTLYVADSLNNRIVSIGNAVNRTTDAGNGQTFVHGGGLNDPLGLVVRPNLGDILTVNGNNGLLLDFAPSGRKASSGLLDGSGSPARCRCALRSGYQSRWPLLRGGCHEHSKSSD